MTDSQFNACRRERRPNVVSIDVLAAGSKPFPGLRMDLSVVNQAAMMQSSNHEYV